jgi:hypothetical protein
MISDLSDDNSLQVSSGGPSHNREETSGGVGAGPGRIRSVDVVYGMIAIDK